MNLNQLRVNLQPYYSILNLKEPSNPFRVKNMPQLGKSFFAFSLIAIFLCFTSCSSPKQASGSGSISNIATGAKPKNIIFLIGDGMGLPQITGAMYMNDNKTVFERFKSIGFHKSHSADNLVTYSAAAATAFAS